MLGIAIGLEILRCNWGFVCQVAFQCFHRQYRHTYLWMNDPDCMVYQDLKVRLFDPAGENRERTMLLAEREKRFHLSAVRLCGCGIFGALRNVCSGTPFPLSRTRLVFSHKPLPNTHT